MNWTWATSLDQVWRTPAFPMWLTLAAAGFFGIIVLVTLLRAEKSVANGALTLITLLAVGIALAASIRGYGPAGGRSASDESGPSLGAALPALSCIDDFAGDTVLSACEKKIFGSAESAAAAVSYAAYQVSRLTALGNVAAANQAMTPELQALRRAVERDRYGLMAQALQARDGCTPTACAAFRSMTDSRQIAVNMDEHTYDGLVARYAPSWNEPPPVAAAPVAAPVAGLGPSVPTGKPTNADFPSAASTPAVSIMSPEPPLPRSPPAAANASIQPPRQSPGPAAAAKKPVPSKRAPVASTPVQTSPDAHAPAATND